MLVEPCLCSPVELIYTSRRYDVVKRVKQRSDKLAEHVKLPVLIGALSDVGVKHHSHLIIMLSGYWHTCGW